MQVKHLNKFVHYNKSEFKLHKNLGYTNKGKAKRLWIKLSTGEMCEALDYNDRTISVYKIVEEETH